MHGVTEAIRGSSHTRRSLERHNGEAPLFEHPRRLVNRLLQLAALSKACALAAFLVGAPLAAHGGMYRGPTPTYRMPGGPVTPGGLLPPPGPNTGGGPLTAANLQGWQFWWEFNKDRYMNLRSKVVAGPTDQPLTGLGAEPYRPSALEMDGEVLPAIDRLMRRYDQPDVQTAGMVAMAKIGRLHPEIDVPGRLRAGLRSGNQEVRETAALSLGISGLEDVLADLIALATDVPDGRRLVGSGSVDMRTRAFAVYGLGLFARRSADPARKAMVLDVADVAFERLGSVERDLAVAAVKALGVLDPDWAEAAHKRLGWQALHALDGVWQKKLGRGDEVIQAHVPSAVAKLLGRGNTDDHRRYLRDYIDELGRRDRSDAVHQGIVLALGEMAMPAETDELAAEASAALWNYYRKGKDQQARFFCLVALGRIGGATNREDLLRELGRARKGTEKPWVALALGLIGWESRQSLGVVDQSLGHALRKELADTANDEFRAACSIALGLTGYTDASRDLIAMLDKYEFHDMVAGYISVGLALLPEQAARAEIRRIIHRATLQPIVVVQGAIALALLGRGEAGQELLDLWVSGESNLARLGGIAVAFRFVGDRRAIDPLLRMMAAPDTTTISRAFLAAALGGVCDKDLLPWSEPYSAGCNYAAVVQTLTNGVTGVLDIL
jgi:HEAT repeat protein